MAVSSKGYRCEYCWSHYAFDKNAHNTVDCAGYKAALARRDLRAIKIQNKMASGGKRVCGFCGSLEHNSTKCPDKFYKLKKDVHLYRDDLDKAFMWLHEIGFGPGAMLSGMASENYYRGGKKDEKIVVIEEFSDRIATNFFTELIRGNTRNWYDVVAVDTTNEKIRRIYLPYHEKYSPKPTSKKVSIIHRASTEDIDSMKKFFPCYSSPVLSYDDADSFFNAGYKFASGTMEIKSPAKVLMQQFQADNLSA